MTTADRRSAVGGAVAVAVGCAGADQRASADRRSAVGGAVAVAVGCAGAEQERP